MITKSRGLPNTQTLLLLILVGILGTIFTNLVLSHAGEEQLGHDAEKDIQEMQPEILPNTPSPEGEQNAIQQENQQRMQQKIQQEMRRKMQPLMQQKMQLMPQSSGTQQDNQPKIQQEMQQNIQQEIQRERQPLMQQEMQQKMREMYRPDVQDLASGLPPEIIEKQGTGKVDMPTIEEAVKLGIKAAAEAARPLIDTEFHQQGRVLIVPDNHKTIQAAIDVAKSGDIVLVRAGIYREQLVMKDGVKLVSDGADQGDELLPVDNARLKLPRRTLRTIIDGSDTKPSRHGMVDFNPYVGRKTIVDGFTIQNLPPQNHHIPGHAHGLNARGASPIITNCLIRNMGSTGIGNHVVFYDEEEPMGKRDFRKKNIKFLASGVIYNNIIHGSMGLGIGCNHFSTPVILGNEVFSNSDAVLGEIPSPGIGIKHGAAPTIIGNLVHDNPGGGVLCKVGKPQGKYGIDQPPHPTIIKNVIHDNGSVRPGITGQGAGSLDTPLMIKGNFIYNPGATGIGLDRESVAVIEENMIADSNDPAIAINGSTALRLNRNRIVGVKGSPGILVVNHGVVVEMLGNTVDSDNYGPRFMVEKGSRVGKVAEPVQ